MSSAAAHAPEVVVVGSVHMDLVAAASRLPVPGESLIGSTFSMHPGGKGGNQSVAAARQGARSAIVARVGDDAFGHELRAKLANAGVDVGNMQLDAEVATGVSTILTSEGGEHVSVIVPSASRELTPQRLALARDALRACKLLLVQLEIRVATTVAAARMVREGGGLVVFNPAPAAAVTAEFPKELWRSVELLLVNRDEAVAIGGEPVRGVEDAIRMCRSLRHRFGVGGVVVTLGDAGLVAVDEAEELALPGYRVPVIDTVGAGDALAGAIAAALARGDPLRRAVELGNAAGALAVGRRGAFEAAPTLAETIAFFDRR